MRAVISTFKSRPHTKDTWHAMWFGVSGLLIFPLLGLIVGAINMLLGGTIGPLAISGGLLTIFGSSVFAIFSLVLSIRALRAGERSWVMWLGLVSASIVASFWAFMIIG